MLAASLAGCTSVVWPPAAPAHPTTVYVLREALHLGLVLPVPARAPEHFVEYGFGDWSWFALGDDAWWRAVPTVLWPTAATLCRRDYATADPQQLAAIAARGGRRLDPLAVDADAIDALRQRLDAAFAAAAEHRARPELGMEFASADGSYWLFHTCADAAATWLRELDCTVTWVLVRGGLAVARPEEPGPE